MLDFKRFHFSRKKPWKGATPFAQLNCENKSFVPNHQILSQCPIQRFLTVITNFLRALSKKEYDFSGIINQALRIFWFQALWKPRFENKRNFSINCDCIIWTFTSWHSLKRTFTSWHTHKGAFTSWHTCMNIYIMAYPQGGIYIMTSLQEAFTSWHAH